MVLGEITFICSGTAGGKQTSEPDILTESIFIPPHRASFKSNAVLTYQESQKSVCVSGRLFPRLHLAEVQFGDVWRAEGAHIQTPIILVDLADVGRHQAVGVMEASCADATIMELCH